MMWWPLVPLAGGGLALVAALVVIPWLVRGARRRVDQQIVDVLEATRGPIVIWGSAAGAFLVLTVIPIPDETRPNLALAATIGTILGVTWFATSLASRLTKAALIRSGVLPNATLLPNLAAAATLMVGLLVALATADVAITPLLTALGVGGIAVALALQPTLTNLFAGVQILASHQLRPGDFVKLASGEEGYVTDVSWRQTTIRALANNTFVVPNSTLASTIVTNMHLPDNELAVLVAVGVDYASDLEHVERVTVEVAREVTAALPGAVSGFEPFIRYHTFGDSSIDFNVILRANEVVEQHLLRHEFIKRLHRRYRDEGIVIPFPIRTIVMADGTVPATDQPELAGGTAHDGAGGPFAD